MRCLSGAGRRSVARPAGLPGAPFGAQGQSWVSCGHVQGVGVGVARCCCSCGCGCGWLLLPAVCEVLLVWLLVFLASMLTVQ
jgi:hypothetical protein